MDVGGYKSDISEFRLYCLNDEDIPAVSSIISGYWGAYQIRDEGGEDGSPAYDFISSRGRRIRLDEDKNLAVYNFANTTKLAIFKNHRRADSPMPFCTLLYGEDFANEAKLATEEIHSVSQFYCKGVHSDYSIRSWLDDFYFVNTVSTTDFTSLSNNGFKLKKTTTVDGITTYYIILEGTDGWSLSMGVDTDSKRPAKMSLKEMNSLVFTVVSNGTNDYRGKSFSEKFLPFNLMNILGTTSKLSVESNDQNLEEIIGEYTFVIKEEKAGSLNDIYTIRYKKNDIVLTTSLNASSANFQLKIGDFATSKNDSREIFYKLKNLEKTGSMTATLTKGSGSSAVSGTVTIRISN